MDSSTTPLVSIILPTFNRAHILGRTIENIFEQTYKNWELFIIDDASVDNTEELVRKFQDERILYIKNDKNKGEAGSRNVAIRIARGAYIANQDSDDLWTPTKLEEEVRLLEGAASGVGAAYSQMKKTFFDGREVVVPADSQDKTSGNLLEVFLRGDFFITGQALLMKTECIRAIEGYDENLRLLNDIEFLIRFAKRYKFIYNSHVRVISEIMEDSHSRNIKKRTVSRDYIFQKHIEEFRKYPAIFTRNAYSIGNAYALEGNMEKARQYLKIAFFSSPLTAKHFFAYILSLLNSSQLYRKAGALYTKFK